MVFNETSYEDPISGVHRSFQIIIIDNTNMGLPDRLETWNDNYNNKYRALRGYDLI
jgi:hypothetical protein